MATFPLLVVQEVVRITVAPIPAAPTAKPSKPGGMMPAAGDDARNDGE
jgi:hypothetical protein